MNKTTNKKREKMNLRYVQNVCYTHIKTKMRESIFVNAYISHMRFQNILIFVYYVYEETEQKTCYLFYFSFSFHYVVFDVFVAFWHHRRKLKMHDNNASTGTSTSVNYTYHFAKCLVQSVSTKYIGKNIKIQQKKNRKQRETKREWECGAAHI